MFLLCIFFVFCMRRCSRGLWFSSYVARCEGTQTLYTSSCFSSCARSMCGCPGGCRNNVCLRWCVHPCTRPTHRRQRASFKIPSLNRDKLFPQLVLKRCMSRAPHRPPKKLKPFFRRPPRALTAAAA